MKTDIFVKWTLIFGFIGMTMTSYMLYTPPELAARRAAAAAQKSEAKDTVPVMRRD